MLRLVYFLNFNHINLPSTRKFNEIIIILVSLWCESYSEDTKLTKSCGRSHLGGVKYFICTSVMTITNSFKYMFAKGVIWFYVYYAVLVGTRDLRTL
jgi:hypothetical protein